MLPMHTLRTTRIALFALMALIATACGSTNTATETESATAAEDTTVDSTEEVEDTEESSASDSDTADAESETVGAVNDTTAGVSAALWGDNVTITVADGEFRFESDGLPNHELPDQFLVPITGQFTPPVTEDEVSPVDTDVAVVASPVDVTITLTPELADEPTLTSLGIIGVAISGAQLFNDYEDQDRQFVAVDDSFEVGGVGFTDSCNAHPLALLADGTGNGNYHYHGVPYCITDAVDVDGEHSTIIGFVLDGFPFYGNKDEGGVTITSADLDACSGHFGPTPEFPEGIYHYHLTDDEAPYSIDCYSGVIDASANAAGPGRGERPAGPPPGDE